MLSYHSLLEKLPLSSDQKVMLRRYQPYYYRLVLPLFLVLCLYLCFVVTLSVMVDRNEIAQEIQVHIEAKTGRQWNTSQEIELSFLPSPKFTIHRLQMSNDYRAEGNNFITADRLELKIPWSEVLKSFPTPSEIHLVGANIRLEKYADGSDNWKVLEGMVRDRSSGDVKVSLGNSRIHYHDKRTDNQLDFSPLEGKAILGERVEISGRAKLGGALVSLAANCSAGLASYPRAFESDCHISYKEDENHASFEGELAMDAAKNLSMEGKVELDAKNILPTLARWVWNAEEGAETSGPLPMKLDGVMRMGQGHLFMDISQLSQGQTEAKAILDFKRSNIQGRSHQLSLNVEAKAVKLEDMKGVSAELVRFLSKQANIALSEVPGLAGTMNVDVQSVWNEDVQAATNLSFRGAWNGRTLDVSKLNMALVEGDIAAHGYIYGGASSLQSNLSYQLEGKNLEKNLTAMGIAFADIGVPYNVPYRSAGQFVLRDDALLFSKSELRLGDLTVKGGINYLFNRGEKLDAVEAGLAISGLSLSNMLGEWQGNTSFFDYPSNLTDYNPYAFLWLETLPVVLKGQFVLKDFMDGGVEDSRASFRLSFKPESLELTRLKASLDDNNVSGSVRVTRAKHMIKPKIVSTLNISKLNLKRLAPYFYAQESGNENVKALWSRKHLSLIPLDHFNGNGDVRIGELSVGNMNMASVRGKWHLIDRRLTFESLNGKAYGGDAAMAVSLVSAEAPEFATSFRLSRVSADTLFKDLFSIGSVAGIVTVNGKLKTSGIHFDSWMNNMRGSVRAAGNNVNVSGVNLEAVSRQIRKKPDIRTVNPMMPDLYGNGGTVFEKVELSAGINGGVVSVDKWIVSARSAIAKLSGEFSLADFVAKIRMEAKLIALGRSAPDLIVQAEGELGALQTRFDTSSIERYISRK